MIQIRISMYQCEMNNLVLIIKTIDQSILRQCSSLSYGPGSLVLLSSEHCLRYSRMNKRIYSSRRPPGNIPYNFGPSLRSDNNIVITESVIFVSYLSNNWPYIRNNT
ncbi:hypothetical protein DERP_003994 [Dermatophagoides pteronyssinus]|uniref:Uncharacterized protein n=1 Tax=Dermatophagoides pteronyssinus TaxID=6956 RepID=A0ABQ8J7Y7_DERPT|nr:hypothetical protein DERP_003994 [Dermatophagoides pteronyssinus]